MIAALAFVLAFLGAGLFALSFFEHQYVEQTGQHQSRLLRTLADSLDSKLLTSRSVLAAAATQVDQTLLHDVAAAQRFLDSRTFLRRRFDKGLLLVSADGTQIIASDSTGLAWPQPLTAEERLMLSQVREQGQPQTSKVYAGSQGQPQLSVAAPVQAAGRGKPAMLLGRLDILSPENAGGLHRYKIGETGYLFMTAADRMMLMHPDARRLMRTAAERGLNLGYDRAVDTGFEGTMETVNSTGLRTLSSFARLPSVGWILAANYPMAEVEAPYWRSVTAVVSTTALAVLSLLVLLMLMMRRLFAPLRQLRAHLTQVGAGQAQAFSGQAHGEIADIAHAYNDMLRRLDASEQARREQEAKVSALNESLEARVKQRTLELQHANTELSASLTHIQAMQSDLLKAEKQAALGRMLASISHELNTPMGNALCTAEALKARAKSIQQALDAATLSRSALRDYLDFTTQANELVERNLTRASTLLGSYKQLSDLPLRQGQGSFDLRGAVDEILASHQTAISRRQVSLSTDVPADVQIQGETDSLRLILDCLLTNALEHGSDAQGGSIRVSAQTSTADWLELRVEDQGKGIAPENLGRVFDPLFTTKLAQGHSGLGLTLVHKLVTEVLGGDIRLHSRPGEGLSVILRLPLRRAAPA